MVLNKRMVSEAFPVSSTCLHETMQYVRVCASVCEYVCKWPAITHYNSAVSGPSSIYLSKPQSPLFNHVSHVQNGGQVQLCGGVSEFVSVLTLPNYL